MKVSPRSHSHGAIGLIFSWGEPHSGLLLITTFIVGSLVLHALCFYAFQIVYPPAVALLPPPGRVTVIDPNTAEGRVLLSWLEAEDPALASTTQPSENKRLSLPKADHAPSYLGYQPTLRDIPVPAPAVEVPSVHPPSAVEPQRGPRPFTSQSSPTVIRFSEELEALNPVHTPPMSYTASKRQPPTATQFWIAVGGWGEIRNCFLEVSSGDANLDQQARGYLALCRFAPKAKSERIIWGNATIEWGNDINLPTAGASGSAPP